MAPTLDELQRKVAELEGYARQVQEMKSTISDFSTKLKAKDITIMKLQQSLKALEGSRDVQLKPESPMANEIVISEAWKAQEAEWKSQERRLLQQIKDLRSMVSETIKPSSTPSTVGIHNTKTGDQAFDVLYISKISEEQQKSKQLQQELDLLKSMPIPYLTKHAVYR
jgi:chromosome condensin MukBEF ATPase and DNA-binding subunit MukB